MKHSPAAWIATLLAVLCGLLPLLLLSAGTTGLAAAFGQTVVGLAVVLLLAILLALSREYRRRRRR